jgi:chemotaxis protein methyltransferase CheR
LIMLLDSERPYKLSLKEFERIRLMAYAFCGLDLKNRETLVEARLGKWVRILNLSSFDEYCNAVERDKSNDLFTGMIDALTTNHTSFFREIAHFDFLCQAVLPESSKNKEFNIWSAGCSTGEEAYSIALSVIDTLGEVARTRVMITATDISRRVLDKARRGLYALSSIEALSTETQREFFLKGNGAFTGQCMVKPEIKRFVDFKEWNLLDYPASLNTFQVIFCRNVMIYFDQTTQQTVLNHLISRLSPGGYIFLGHAESLNNLNHPLEYIRTAIYRNPVIDRI